VEELDGAGCQLDDERRSIRNKSGPGNYRARLKKTDDAIHRFFCFKILILLANNEPSNKGTMQCLKVQWACFMTSIDWSIYIHRTPFIFISSI